MYIERNLEKEILKASKDYPVVMLCGARQVGKSTMLNHIKEENRKYISLDNQNARRLALEDPTLFFETYGYPLIIDEFQRAPGILLEIKKIVDEKALKQEECKGMFWLTGSQKFRMMKDVSESLAGRVAIFEMAGLSQQEILKKDYGYFNGDLNQLRQRENPHYSLSQIYQKIFLGDMPRLNTSNADRDLYYQNYINTYLERDIHDLSQVGKMTDFYSFLVYMAARTAQELKYEDISRAIGISSPTAKSWVSILERSGIIYILRPYSSNLTNRLIKTPKMYFMDTGLAAYLCKWPNYEVLMNSMMDGAFFETYIVSEIVKSYLNSGKNPDLYYYRDRDQKEIDLLITTYNAIYPIEIKKGTSPNHPDKNISVLNKFNLEVKPCLVICNNDEIFPYNRSAWYIPAGII